MLNLGKIVDEKCVKVRVNGALSSDQMFEIHKNDSHNCRGPPKSRIEKIGCRCYALPLVLDSGHPRMKDHPEHNK